MEWDDTIEYDGDGLIYDPSNDMTPTEQLIKYLDTLFYDDEYVGYVTNDVWQNSDGKWIPKKGQYDRTAGELINLLERHPDDIGAVLGDSKVECGAWIRFNPVDGVGVKNENIVRFTHALVESDDMPISEQDAIYRKFELPIACIVHSGGRSLHAIVRVDAMDAEEYRRRVDFLYDFLNKNGLKIDKANRNPSRLSRLPCVIRNGIMQTLVDTNIGRSNWNEWLDYVEGNTDELPREKTSGQIRTKKEFLNPELIEGVVRIGHKMLISGSSKAGKSFLLLELAIALAEGRNWLGFQCRKTRVFYVNLEIDEKIVIDEDQAVIVRMIYRMFLVNGKTPTGIARHLKSQHIKTPTGKSTNWTKNTVTSILTNEKYKGDALLQKTYTVNYLDHSTAKNTGQIPQYYVENNHPAIIDRDTWEQIQLEIERRDKLGAHYSSSDIFASKLICADCGGFYGKKSGMQILNMSDSYTNVIVSSTKAKTNVELHTSMKMKLRRSSLRLTILWL